MNAENHNREQWLKDTEEFFRSVQSYNTTVITIGYATFFGMLLFLQDKVKSPLLFWAALCVTVSAIIFISYELINNIKLAWKTRKTGQEGKRFFRYWAIFFIPALTFAVIGTAILTYLFLRNI